MALLSREWELDFLSQSGWGQFRKDMVILLRYHYKITLFLDGSGSSKIAALLSFVSKEQHHWNLTQRPTECILKYMVLFTLEQ